MNKEVYNEPVKNGQLETTKGYFIKTSVAGYIRLTNLINFNDSYIDVNAGWNLFGVSNRYTIDDPNTVIYPYDPYNPPLIIVPNSIYTIDSNNDPYFITDNILIPNVGYWLKSTRDTRLYLKKIIYISELTNSISNTILSDQKLIFDINYIIQINTTLLISPGAQVYINPAITIRNNGTVQNNGKIENYGTIQNYGTIENSDGIIVNNNTILNLGYIHSTGGKILKNMLPYPGNGSIINYGNINSINNLDIGALFNLDGSNFTNNSSNSSIGYISNYNNFTNRGTLNSVELDNRGTFINNGGALNVSDQIQLLNYPLNNPTSTFTNMANGNITVFFLISVSTLNNNDSIINITYKYENFSSGLLNNNTNGTINVQIFNSEFGALINNAGSIIITNQFNTDSDGSITNTGSISVAGVIR